MSQPNTNYSGDAMDRLEQKVDNLHRCLDEFREESKQHQTTMEKYFIGLEPEDHIEHHVHTKNEMKNSEKWSDTKKTIVGGVITSIIVAVIGWMYSRHEDQQRATMLEQIKEQKQIQDAFKK